MEPSTTFPRSCLEVIHVDDLQSVWHLIRPGLEKVREHSQSHWMQEDVYMACKQGHSSLHISYVDGCYAGFCVLTPTRHWDGMALHIWCAYNAGQHDVVDMHIPDLETIAKTIHAKRITFWSRRKWDRRIKPYGFSPTQTEYVKEL